MLHCQLFQIHRSLGHPHATRTPVETCTVGCLKIRYFKWVRLLRPLQCSSQCPSETIRDAHPRQSEIFLRSLRRATWTQLISGRSSIAICKNNRKAFSSQSNCLNLTSCPRNEIYGMPRVSSFCKDIHVVIGDNPKPTNDIARHKECTMILNTTKYTYE